MKKSVSLRCRRVPFAWLRTGIGGHRLRQGDKERGRQGEREKGLTSYGSKEVCE